jgi:hypothetical protein
MARVLPIAGIALGLASCGPSAPAEKPLSVPEVVANIDTFNGKTVRVTGYLGSCAGYDCVLFIDRAGREAMRRRMQAIVRHASIMPDEPQWLGIGSANDFDSKVAALQNRNVTITGKVTNRCRYAGWPACTDRSTDIVPIDVVPSKDN